MLLEVNSIGDLQGKINRVGMESYRGTLDLRNSDVPAKPATVPPIVLASR